MNDSSDPNEHPPANTVHLGDLRDLTDGQMRVFADVGPHGTVVVRIAGTLYAVPDNCSHRDAKLSEGRLRGNLLTCPLHGAQFDARTGEHQGPPASMPLPCLSITETADGATIVL